MQKREKGKEEPCLPRKHPPFNFLGRKPPPEIKMPPEEKGQDDEQKRPPWNAAAGGGKSKKGWSHGRGSADEAVQGGKKYWKDRPAGGKKHATIASQPRTMAPGEGGPPGGDTKDHPEA